jgi:hypothetical protein
MNDINGLAVPAQSRAVTRQGFQTFVQLGKREFWGGFSRRVCGGVFERAREFQKCARGLSARRSRAFFVPTNQLQSF